LQERPIREAISSIEVRLSIVDLLAKCQSRINS